MYAIRSYYGYEVRQLTSGDYDVTKFYGFDPKKKLFYYQAAKESPMQREIYYVSLDGKKQGKLSAEAGTNDAEFSSGFHRITSYNVCYTKLLRTAPPR